MNIPTSQGLSPGEPAFLTIGDKQYRIDELSDDVRKLAQAILDCDQQIIQSKRNLNYLEIARLALLNDLKSRLAA
jgi:Family of unknown function (DUF6447)